MGRRKSFSEKLREVLKDLGMRAVFMVIAVLLVLFVIYPMLQDLLASATQVP